MERASKTAIAKSKELSAVMGEVGSKINNLIGDARELITGVPELALYRSVAPTVSNSCSYAPSLLIIPQGENG